MPVQVTTHLASLQTALAGLAGNPAYDYNVSSIKIALDATGFSAAGSAGASGWANYSAASLTTQLRDGWLNSRNAVTGVRYDTIAGLTSNATDLAASVDVRVRAKTAAVPPQEALSLQHIRADCIFVCSFPTRPPER